MYILVSCLQNHSVQSNGIDPSPQFQKKKEKEKNCNNAFSLTFI